MTIRLHIEQLVVRGVPLTATDRAELGAALQAELGRLLAAEDGDRSWASPGHRPQLEAEPVAYQPGGSAVRLGQAVAGSVFASLRSGSTGHGSPAGSASC